MADNMSLMLAFCNALLSSISSWLMSEPMIYFVGFALMLFIVRIIVDIFYKKGGV